MERRAIAVQGIVQGVGFRPFVYGLAASLQLTGFVKNRVGDVLIEVEGDSGLLDRFLDELATHSPPLARVEQMSWETLPRRQDTEFVIHASDSAPIGDIFISPDVATCSKCIDELFSSADRRYRYPFLNCTHCGPRLTIITEAPYDRPRTTMAGLPMCSQCRAEYDDPSNRRFHAQPTCCPRCGPQLRLLDNSGTEIKTANPLAAFAEALRGAKIGALKGIGGYHLACDARSNAVVAELRRRKARHEKPFALMVPNETAAAELCLVSPAERDLLRSPRRPIVLLQRRSNSFRELADQIAPGNPVLGVMLPYTPVHHLLIRDIGNIPLVMTSGNRVDEPIANDDGDAVSRLGGIADLYLVHNRPINVRCDDSVTRVVDGAEMLVRRARGYAPEPVTLPVSCPLPILAVGGQLKGTFALGRGRHAFVSHHLGDLDHYEAYRAFVKDVALYEELFDNKPQLLVHDLHPDYASTNYARARSAAEGIPLLPVQHHHAHMASCMAENGLTGPVIGVSFDGTGYGTDGAIWGGEFLLGDYVQSRRAAHLRYVGMPGGAQVIREPWRMALAHLDDAGESDDLLAAHAPVPARRTVRQILERRFNTPLTSSIGRLFDAVAVLATGRAKVSFEGQAAMELEWQADDMVSQECYPWDMEQTDDGGLVIDSRPLMKAVAEDVRRKEAAATIARRFHATMVDCIVATCAKIRNATAVNSVALSGGVFMNALLTREAARALSGRGFAVYRHRKLPANDGGLSFGQLAVAAATRQRRG